MLCPTAQLIVSALEGSSEAVLLLASSGVVLHKNQSAQRLFETEQQQDDNDADAPSDDVFTFLTFSKPWYDVEAQGDDATAFIRKDGKAVSVRLTKLGGCPCCDALYTCVYIRPTTTRSNKNDELCQLKRIRDTVDASFDPMFITDEQGIIVMANDAATTLFGWTYEEFLGNSISMICGGGHAAHHDKYMKRYLETGIARIMGTKREVPAKRKDGTEFPVELGIKEIKSEDPSESRVFCGFIKDLSAVKKHEMELLHRESLIQGMIDSSFDPMFEIDERGIINIVNQAAVALFGWSRDEFIGSNISMICGGGHAEHHAEYMTRYLQTGTKHIIGRKRQVPARRKDGSEFDIELGVQEVISNTGERTFCGYVRDLTLQKLEKRNLRKKESLIQEKFFQDVDPDAEEGCGKKGK